MAAYLPSHKLSKLDEQDILGTAWEIKRNVSNLLLWTSAHGDTSVSWLAKSYIHQPSADNGCHLENLPRDMMRKSRKSMLSVHLATVVEITTRVCCHK